MKDRIITLICKNKLAVALIAAFIIILLNPLTAYADRRDDLLGVWRGTYINTRGLNGYEFQVFRDGADYLAVVQFFPVDGSPENQIPPGNTLNAVRFDAATNRFYLDTLMWLNRPEGINAVGQTGTLDGNRFTGYLQGNPRLTFDVRRVERSIFPLALAHDHITIPVEIAAATCHNEGIIAHECIFCGIETSREIIPALPHTPSGTWVVSEAATCATAGFRVQYCTVCNEEALRESIPQLPHTYEWVVYLASTCYAPGFRVQHCTVCNVIGLDELIPARGHNFIRERVSGNIFIPPIVYSDICVDCDYEPELAPSFAMAWLLPTIILLPGLVVMIILLSIRGAKKNRKFVCPYCFKQHPIFNVQFRCTNLSCPDVDDIELSLYEGLNIEPNNPNASPPLKRKLTFPAPVAKYDIPKFAQCPRCGKGTSKTVCPSCHNSLPESVLTGEDKITSV